MSLPCQDKGWRPEAPPSPSGEEPGVGPVRSARTEAK
jgi:hypothetical protein